MLFALLPPHVARAAITYTVNTTADTVIGNNCDGACSVREALIGAGQSAGVDTINFNIPNGGLTPRVIQPLSPLPAIQEGVNIDGTTQGPTNQVIIDGSQITAANTPAFTQFTASGGSYRGLVIQNFTGAGIVLGTGGSTVVAGNIIGLDYTGKISRPNGAGIALSNSPSNTIGGPQLADRNLISGNQGVGISLVGTSDGTLIQNDYVGLDYAGGVAHGNGSDGIQIQSSNNVIKDNVISANKGHGANLFGSLAS